MNWLIKWMKGLVLFSLHQEFLWFDRMFFSWTCGSRSRGWLSHHFRCKQLYKSLAPWNVAYTFLIIASQLFPICLTPHNSLPSSSSNRYRLLPLHPGCRTVLAGIDSFASDEAPVNSLCWGRFVKWQQRPDGVLWLLDEPITSLSQASVSSSIEWGTCSVGCADWVSCNLVPN